MRYLMSQFFKPMRKEYLRIWLCLLLILFCILGVLGSLACSGGGDGSAAEVRAQEAERWMSILTASSGTLDQTLDQRGGDMYTLTLLNPSGQVARFTDRPARETSIMALDEFLLMWDEGSDSFLADPPNAAIEYKTGTDTVVFVVELTNPRRDAILQTLIFDVLEINPYGGLSHYADGTSPIQFAQFSDPTLFVDSSSYGGCHKVSCGDHATYPSCMCWSRNNDSCYNCNDCFNAVSWCSDSGCCG